MTSPSTTRFKSDSIGHRIWSRISGRGCQHDRTLVVMSVGVRRAVCEDCGRISFEMERSPQPVPGRAERPKLPKAARF